jgi:hypothetical protein
MPFSTLPAGTLPEPTQDHRRAEAAFQCRALAARERRLAAIGPSEVFGAVVGGEPDDRVLLEAVVLEVLHHRTDDVVELRHAGFLNGPAILRIAQALVFRGQVRDHMHASRIQPEEERLALRSGLIEELEGVSENFVVHRLHAPGTKLARVLDPLLADLAPARLHGRVVDVGREAVDHVARTDGRLEVLRIVGMARVLHRVEVIEVSVKFVEAVHGRQELVQVAEVVLAKLAGGVAQTFERRGDGRGLGGHSDRRTGLSHRRQPRADWQLASDEVRASRRAACLGVVVREQHAFGGELVEVRGAARHQPAVIGADVPDADVVAHDHDDIGRLRLLRGRRRARHHCGGEQRKQAEPAIPADSHDSPPMALGWLKPVGFSNDPSVRYAGGVDEDDLRHDSLAVRCQNNIVLRGNTDGTTRF